ncbi:MAG: ferrochelatase [Candidatus Melainabacteria bacterium]|jgi:ferrochelatase|nr:ferrochelatase [Candidatus Melainabacteria bacterium]
MQYDAVLVISFGGPEGMDDVMPFLQNVLRGKNIPEKRMKEVVHHYELFGGVSPINGQNRRLISALKEEMRKHNIDLPVYWGNRNWHPMLADTLSKMKDQGVKRAIAFVTSAYGSYSGCRQYLDDIERARAEVGEGAPEIDKLRLFYNHPKFIEANAEHLKKSLNRLPEPRRHAVHVAFTAHSIPTSMAESCDYRAQLLDTARLVARAASVSDWSLAFQSRSGPPTQPWLEPDIQDHLRDVAHRKVKDVIVLPIGFVSDHMEIIYDLDTEAASAAGKAGLNFDRAATVGTHPAFVSMIRELIEERLQDAAERPCQGERGPSPDFCQPECCPPPLRPQTTTSSTSA